MEAVELFDESKITYPGDDVDDDPSASTVKQIAMDEYVLEVDGFVCPEALVTQFTPLEFEEVRKCKSFMIMIYIACANFLWLRC